MMATTATATSSSLPRPPRSSFHPPCFGVDASPLHVEDVTSWIHGCPPPTKPRRAVTFSTATIYTFRTAYGGSAVPKVSGPPIGLAPSHAYVTHISLADSAVDARQRHRVLKFNHLERIALLKASPYHVSDIAEFCADALVIRKSRQDTLAELRGDRIQRRKRRAMQSLLQLVEASCDVSQHDSAHHDASKRRRVCANPAR